MSKYIRKRYIDTEALKSYLNPIARKTDCHFLQLIDNIPTADVEEVIHERWIFDGQKKTKSGYRFTYHCSRCFRLVRQDLDEAPINEIYPYCHCGAKMDKEKEENG